MRTTLPLTALLTAGSLALAACGSDAEAGTTGTGTETAVGALDVGPCRVLLAHAAADVAPVERDGDRRGPGRIRDAVGAGLAVLGLGFLTASALLRRRAPDAAPGGVSAAPPG